MSDVINVTVKSQVIEDALLADTFFTRFAGYMFRRKPHHKAIIIKPCSSIHTFFMKFPIDVLFIDQSNKVIKKLTNLQPRKVIMPVKDAETVIEGEVGAFDGVEVGHSITL